jgi:hypothetical protein
MLSARRGRPVRASGIGRDVVAHPTRTLSERRAGPTESVVYTTVPLAERWNGKADDSADPQPR